MFKQSSRKWVIGTVHINNENYNIRENSFGFDIYEEMQLVSKSYEETFYWSYFICTERVLSKKEPKTTNFTVLAALLQFIIYGHHFKSLQ